jgi:hypothetical protein
MVAKEMALVVAEAVPVMVPVPEAGVTAGMAVDSAEVPVAAVPAVAVEEQATAKGLAPVRAVEAQAFTQVVPDSAEVRRTVLTAVA